MPKKKRGYFSGLNFRFNEDARKTLTAWLRRARWFSPAVAYYVLIALGVELTVRFIAIAVITVWLVSAVIELLVRSLSDHPKPAPSEKAKELDKKTGEA